MKAVIQALVVIEIPDVWSEAEAHQELDSIERLCPSLRTRGGALNARNPRIAAVLSSQEYPAIQIVANEVTIATALGWESPASDDAQAG